jgi:hypothetical protein
MTEEGRNPSPFADWFAVRNGSRGLWLCDKAACRKAHEAEGEPVRKGTRDTKEEGHEDQDP